MKLEKYYALNSKDFDANGKCIRVKNSYFDELVRHFLLDFFNENGRIFHPTTLVMSGLMMKKLERSVQMEDEYYFGIMTLNGSVDHEYNLAIARKEKRGNIVAISSEIPGYEDEPVHLFIDDEMDNNTIIVRWLSDSDDDVDDFDEMDTPINDPKEALVYV